MSNEQPHVEVLSRNKVNKSTVVIALPITIGIAAVLVVVLVEHLAEVWLLVEFVLLSLVLSLVILTGVAVWYVVRRVGIHLLHLERQSRLLTWPEYASWVQTDGYVRNLSAEVIEASRPLQIAAPLPEISEAEREEINRSKVLALYFEQGKGMHQIEHELRLPYNQVREWCNTAKELRSKKAESDQMRAGEPTRWKHDI